MSATKDTNLHASYIAWRAYRAGFMNAAGDRNRFAGLGAEEISALADECARHYADLAYPSSPVPPEPAPT